MALFFRLILALFLSAGAYSTAFGEAHEQDGDQRQEEHEKGEQEQEQDQDDDHEQDQDQGEQEQEEEQKQEIVALSPDQLDWQAAPAHFEPGAEIAPVQGDFMVPGLATLRLRFPAGYEVKPHFHGAEEMVTVLSGELAFGKGEVMDMSTTETYGPGTFIEVPAGKAHYVRAETDVEIQLTSTGVFTMIYVNPADDPRER